MSMELTKRLWEQPTDKGVLAYHIIQSFSPGEATPDQVHEIGCEFARRFLADRFECTVSTHLDKGHLHNHIVVNSVSYADGKMFRNNFDTYYHGIRQVSDELCRENRLSVIETDGKGKSYDEWLSGQTGKPTIRGMVRKDVELNGFYGAYWACAGGSDCAVITMIGDDPEDRLARSAVKWLCGCGVNVLTMSPAKKDYGHHNYPLERVETAISWLKANGNRKIGIAGASTTGTLALTAAAMFPDITLTIAMTPSDFVWQGFMQGKRDGCKEWPVEGESLFSYRGKLLPYMPFCYQHPDYWHCIAAESKRAGDMVNSRKLFDDSETAHPIEPEEYIPVENIRGKLLLIGAEDDALWDTAKYIRRMEKRLAEKPHECEIETMVYAHGTHFVFPEGMLKIMLPVGAGLFVRLAFQAAKQFPEACRQTRQDIDRRVSAAIHAWTSTE